MLFDVSIPLDVLLLFPCHCIRRPSVHLESLQQLPRSSNLTINHLSLFPVALVHSRWDPGWNPRKDTKVDKIMDSSEPELELVRK